LEQRCPDQKHPTGRPTFRPTFRPTQTGAELLSCLIFFAKFLGSALSGRAPSTVVETLPIHRNEPYYFVTLPMEVDGRAQGQAQRPTVQEPGSEAKTFAETPCLRM
jgi:hypothetical protein